VQQHRLGVADRVEHLTDGLCGGVSTWLGRKVAVPFAVALALGPPFAVQVVQDSHHRGVGTGQLGGQPFQDVAHAQRLTWGIPQDVHHGGLEVTQTFHESDSAAMVRSRR
jgi:hypothetical protein